MSRLRFRTGIAESLALVACVVLFVHLGNWQWGKAQRQSERQAQIEARGHDAALLVSNAAIDPDNDAFRSVIVRGRYVAAYQILLDNQVHGERAGYHVLTPLRIGDGQDLIYVNRGWVAANADRAKLPDVAPPADTIEIAGTLVAPPKPRWLAAPPPNVPNQPWPPVWQSFDIGDLRGRTSDRIAPLIVQLDPKSQGGYDRSWPRLDSRVAMHLSYAYQWYGLSALAVLIYLIAGVRRGRRP